MDRFILDHAKREPRARRACARAFFRPSRARCCASRCTATAPRICRRGSKRSSATSRRPASAAVGGARITRRDQARIWSLREASLGLSMAMKGDAKSLSFVEDTAVAPEKLRDYIDRFLKVVRAAWHRRRRVRTRVGRVPARPTGRQPQDRGRRSALRGDRQRHRRSRARVRRRTVRRARRRAGPRPVHRRRCSGRCCTTRSARSSAPSIPDGLFNPGKIVDTPPLTANLRYGAGYQTPDPPTLLRLRRARRPRARRRDVQRSGRLPQDARGDDVPVVHGDA